MFTLLQYTPTSTPYFGEQSYYGCTHGTASSVDTTKCLEENMEEKMTNMKRELMKEREEADEKLVKRMKLEKAPTFKKKATRRNIVLMMSSTARCG